VILKHLLSDPAKHHLTFVYFSAAVEDIFVVALFRIFCKNPPKWFRVE
jgi:hypothetical protein